MRFGAIFASLTLALSASAAAILPRDGLVNAVGAAGVVVSNVADHIALAKQDVHRNDKRQINTGSLTDLLNSGSGTTGTTGDANPLSGLTPRGDRKCYTDFIEEATGAIVKVVADIDVEIKGEVRVDVILRLLGLIEGIVIKLVADVVASIDAHVDVKLSLKAIVAIVVALVEAVVAIILRLVAVVEVEVIEHICLSIVANIVLILKAIIAVEADIAVLLYAALKVYLRIDIFAAIGHCLGH